MINSLPAQTWQDPFQKVDIPSSIDQNRQPAWFYRALGEAPRPLIVSLHTWSGDYTQEDTLAQMCIEKNYHYIHPNFRGQNNRPEACGSELAIQDIDDAIAYALENAYVDSSEIHITGTSGGGYATLLMYMKSRFPVKTFSAWVPISDIGKWYYESKGRGNKYALDIAKATNPGREMSEDNHSLSEEEAHKRSPMYMPTPTEKRQNSKLFIYAGIHDGYTGSVPISQSLNFFNKVVRDYDPNDHQAMIPMQDIQDMVAARSFPADHNLQIADRDIHYQRDYRDLMRITIFEGTHERLSSVALDHISPRKILLIGDSNGAAKDGWTYQLKKLRFVDRFYNTSISGNTIGFDNLDNQQLNTLRNVDEYVSSGNEAMNGITDIVIMLGTNDCKAVFDPKLKQVPKNLDELIRKIKSHSVYAKDQPRIYIVSPPPFARDEFMLEKYHGGADRIAYLVPQFKKVAEKQGCYFIDVYSSLLPKWDHYASDGIHLITEGQFLIGRMIDWGMQ